MVSLSHSSSPRPVSRRKHFDLLGCSCFFFCFFCFFSLRALGIFFFLFPMALNPGWRNNSPDSRRFRATPMIPLADVFFLSRLGWGGAWSNDNGGKIPLVGRASPSSPQAFCLFAVLSFWRELLAYLFPRPVPLLRRSLDGRSPSPPHDSGHLGNSAFRTTNPQTQTHGADPNQHAAARSPPTPPKTRGGGGGVWGVGGGKQCLAIALFRNDIATLLIAPREHKLANLTCPRSFE